MTVRALARQHQLDQINNGALVAALVMELFTEFKAGRLTRDELVVSLVASDLLAHDAAVRLASQFVEAVRNEEGADGVLVVPEFDQGASLGRAVGVLRDLDSAQLAATTEQAWDTEFWRIVEALAVRADRFAKQPGRETVAMSATASGRRWRRVTDGDPCAFCAMLATRSDYRTAESAGRVVGRARGYGNAQYKATGEVFYGGTIQRGDRKGQDRSRGSRQLGEQYHDRCGCTVVEVLSEWVLSPAEERQQQLYEAAAAQCDAEGVPRTAANVTARMRAQGAGIIHDAHKPKTQAGGSGGGTKPPRPRTVGSGEGSSPRDYRRPRERTASDNAAWQARQDALPFVTNGTTMKPHEIEFAESFVASGYSILRWLPQGVRDKSTGRILPESDFEWTPGVDVELKRSNNAQTIKDYIKANLSKGKRVFMVDFGERQPYARVLRAVRKFEPEGASEFEVWCFWDGHMERLR